MKPRSSVTLILAVVILSGFFSGALPLGFVGAGKVEVIVGFHGIPDIGLLKQIGGVVHEVYSIIPAVFVSLPQTAVGQLEKNPKIAYICSDGTLNVTGDTSGAVSGALTWGVNAINASQAWSQSLGDGVKVAVLDTGVGPARDLVVNGGYNFVADNGNYGDDNGHGTMVAGIIAAAMNSSIGVMGVAPDARIYAVKVMDSQGVGTVDMAVNGIQWAVENGMQIISMSWTLNDVNGALQSALQAAYNHDLLLVGAAGNSGDAQSGIWSPASFDSVIAVSGIQQDYTRLADSSFGSKIELTAPGQMIYSTWLNNELGQGNGTSMAAAFVSGTAALVWAKNPSLTNDEVRAILDESAVDLGAAGRDIFYGFGLVNASAAVLATPRNFAASFSWSPSIAYNDEKISFDASASFGGVSGYTSYTWVFSDGFSTKVDSPFITHTFTSEGTYSLNLVVNDTFGFINSTTQTISVLKDSVAPITHDNYDGLLHTSAFTIVLTAQDNQSGVATTYYKINNGPIETISVDGQPLITSNGLNNTLEYWSIDFSGNIETPHNILTNIKLNMTSASDSNPTSSPPSTLKPPNTPTNSTTSPTGTNSETLPTGGQGLPFWVIAVVIMAAAVLAVATWLKRK